MTDYAVTIEFKNTISLEKDGNKLNQSQKMGQNYIYRLINPDYTLHDDEVGGDTIQKGGINIGGVMFLTSTVIFSKTVTSDNDNYFTVMRFIYDNGNLVVCLIIMVDVQQKNNTIH